MLIGLTGRAGSGKTTIAKFLAERDGFIIRTYAYPLKKSLVELTGLGMEYFTDIVLKERQLEIGKSPRELMQLMGTEFVREMVNKDFWIWRMRDVILRISTEIDVVIDDCRFENETALVREMGGQVIHLDREYDAVTDKNNHASEKPLRRLAEDYAIQSWLAGEEYTYSILKEMIG